MLYEMLEDPRPATRGDAALGLLRLQEDIDRVIDPLLDAVSAILAEQHEGESDKVGLNLCLDEEIMTQLCGLVDDFSPVVPRAERMLEVFLMALNGKDSKLRPHAVYGLRALGPMAATALPPLECLAQDPLADRFLQAFAMDAIQEIARSEAK